MATFGLATALAEEEDGADRLENVSELFAAAEVFERDDVEDPDDEATDLELFLQSVSLRSDLDEADFDGEAVTMITLHNAKGLEFPVVFLGGLEEGLFPLSRAMEAPGGLEEERRLFYVGVTRAMDRLSLTYADHRWRAGMRAAPPRRASSMNSRRNTCSRGLRPRVGVGGTPGTSVGPAGAGPGGGEGRSGTGDAARWAGAVEPTAPSPGRGGRTADRATPAAPAAPARAGRSASGRTRV